MANDLRALIDDLMAKREAGTPGELTEAPTCNGYHALRLSNGVSVGRVEQSHREFAPLIVAAVNAIPELAAALGPVLAIVDAAELDREEAADLRELCKRALTAIRWYRAVGIGLSDQPPEYYQTGTLARTHAEVERDLRFATGQFREFDVPPIRGRARRTPAEPAAPGPVARGCCGRCCFCGGEIVDDRCATRDRVVRWNDSARTPNPYAKGVCVGCWGSVRPKQRSTCAGCGRAYADGGG